MSKLLFITGTGTDVGKTYISALIVKKLAEAGKSIAYFKPAMSGNKRTLEGKLIPGDAQFVKESAHLAQALDSMCPYVFEEPYSPHLAASLNDVSINVNTINEALRNLFKQYEYILIEGAGGLFCPLSAYNKIFTIADFIKQHNLPCLIVANAGLGTINYLSLTVNYLYAQSIPVQGFILNNFEQENLLHNDNLKICEKLTNLKALACIQNNAKDLSLDISILTNLFREE